MKRILILLLIVSCSPTKKFQETKEKWEKSVEDLNKLNLEITQNEDAILFIGSSSIRLWNTIEQDIEPYSSIRRGYGGAKYTDLIHFTERLVEPHNVKAVGIFVANDIKTSQQLWQSSIDTSLFEINYLTSFGYRYIESRNVKTT